MKFSAALFVGVSLLAATPAIAQNAPGRVAVKAPIKPAVGATVYDPQGGTIGTIDSITADAIVLSTGANKVALPAAAIGSNGEQLVANTTRADLDAQAAQAQAQRAAALQAQMAPGAPVFSADNVSVGTIKTADPQYVTVTTSTGSDVKLPVAAFSQGDMGAKITMSGAQFNAAVSGATGDASADTGAAADDTAGADDAADDE